MHPQSNHAKRIFLKAVEDHAPGDRSRYLNEACDGDTALRNQVEALLRAYAEPNSMLDGQGLVATVHRNIPDPVGAQIGPYKIREQLAEGGMGVVYVAEQLEPVRRKVALKIIRPGMATKEVIARFEAERQALAMMDHPNIARVFDGGTVRQAFQTDASMEEVRRAFQTDENTDEVRQAFQPDENGPQAAVPESSVSPPARQSGKPNVQGGQPYFVMELVRGIPIAEYCDEHNLSTRERLKLFLQVCRAIQHAHQKGIIHRDLKPSNVLVTELDGRAVPKVIDFGVAKAVGHKLTEQTIYTQFTRMVGTPLYMSPEQAGMGAVDIDTRSDIYSLGVLLYELLTGNTPFDRETLKQADFDELRRIIREDDPPRPSAAVSTLRADALPTVADHRRSDPRRLCDTLKGELDWIVMKALDKDRGQRYESASAMAADVERYLSGEAVLACPPSLGYRFRKSARRNKVGLATGSLVAASLMLGVVGVLWQAVRANREAERARTEAATATAVMEFVQTDLLGSADPHAEPNRELRVREVLDRAAESLASRFGDQPLVEAGIRSTVGDAYRSLGEYEDARRHLKRAHELHKQQLGTDRRKSAESELSLLWLDHDLGHHKALQPKLEQFVERCRTDFGDEDALTLRAQRRLADILHHSGDSAEAEELARETLERQTRVLGREHRETLGCMQLLAGCISSQGRKEKAEKLFREAMEISDRVLGPQDNTTLSFKHELALLIYDQGEYAESEDLFRQILQVERRVLGAAHPSTLTTVVNLVLAIDKQGRKEEAEKLSQEALEISRRALGPEHPVTRTLIFNRATEADRQGRHAEAAEHFKELLEIDRRLLGDQHPRTLSTLNNLMAAVGNQYNDAISREDYNEAEPLLRELLPTLQRIRGPDHHDTKKFRTALAYVLAAQSRDLRTADDVSRREMRQAVELAREAVEIQPEHAAARKYLGFALYRIGQWEAAVEALDQVDKYAGGCRCHRIMQAMAHWQLGHEDIARTLHAEGAAWTAARSSELAIRQEKWLERVPEDTNREYVEFLNARRRAKWLEQVRGEAEQLLGLTEDDRRELIEKYRAERQRDSASRDPPEERVE